jgi:hypothetical protein
VPYRDAALTMLLRDSFGGRSCTSVVINVACEAEHAEETLCSLRFGERMAVVRNSPTVVAAESGAESARRAAALRRALGSGRAELERLEAEGRGGGFVAGCAAHEREMLRANMEALRAQREEVRRCTTAIVEARTIVNLMTTSTSTSPSPSPSPSGAGGGGTGDLEARLALASEKAENLGANVWRQQSIKSLWAPPSPAYTRKLGEVKALEAELTLLADPAAPSGDGGGGGGGPLTAG